MKLDKEVEFGAQDSNEACVCYGNSGVLEMCWCYVILIMVSFVLTGMPASAAHLIITGKE
jgi:hypothetical protein